MIISQAAGRVLSILEQTDEEEYNLAQAEMDVNQAIAEIADDSELSTFNVFTHFTIATDDYDGVSDWDTVTGRADLTSVLSSTIGRIGYIKKIWLDSGGSNIPFVETRVDALLDKYGDAEGQPEKYAVDGDQLFWRPVGESGTEYTARIWWASVPPEYGSGEEPTVIAQAPYAVIYRACALACVWLVDDDRAVRFDKMAQRLIDKYVVRDSMHGDSRIEMETYNG